MREQEIYDVDEHELGISENGEQTYGGLELKDIGYNYEVGKIFNGYWKYEVGEILSGYWIHIVGEILNIWNWGDIGRYGIYEVVRYWRKVVKYMKFWDIEGIFVRYWEILYDILKEYLWNFEGIFVRCWRNICEVLRNIVRNIERNIVRYNIELYCVKYWKESCETLKIYWEILTEYCEIL